MPFQSQVNTQPAIGVPGDFCDLNPRYMVDAGPGGLVAGPAGVVVAGFAWAVPATDANGANAVVNSFGTGPVTGFVHREQQALFTAYLQETSMIIPQGFPLALCSGAGLFVKNSGATQALPGMKAYANLANGSLINFATTGSPIGGGSGSASTIAAETAAFVGGIAGDILTVSSVTSGTIVPGGALTGGATGTSIVAQIGGTTGGIGTYYLSIPEQTVVAGTSFTLAYGLLTVGGTVVNGFGVGNVLSGAGVTAGTVITAPGTGLGGAGTYIVSPSQTVASEALSVAAINVETKWIAVSSGLSGETVKISDKPLG